MFRNDLTAVYFLSVYLIIWCILLQFDNAIQYAFWMLLISPVLLFWIVYTVKNKSRITRQEKENKHIIYDHDKTDRSNSL